VILLDWSRRCPPTHTVAEIVTTDTPNTLFAGRGGPRVAWSPRCCWRWSARGRTGWRTAGGLADLLPKGSGRLLAFVLAARRPGCCPIYHLCLLLPAAPLCRRRLFHLRATSATTLWARLALPGPADPGPGRLPGGHHARAVVREVTAGSAGGLRPWLAASAAAWRPSSPGRRAPGDGPARGGRLRLGRPGLGPLQQPGQDGLSGDPRRPLGCATIILIGRLAADSSAG